MTAPLTEMLPTIFLLGAQFLLILISFFYFRNKLKKNSQRLNEQILRNRKEISSQKQLFAKEDLKMSKMLKKISGLQSSISASQKSLSLIETGYKPHLFAILSLPKCGGSTIAATLKHSFPNSLVRHWHIHSKETMQKFAAEAEKSNNVKIRNAMISHLRGAIGNRSIINRLTKKNITFIAGVREPIALGISLLFEQGLNYGESQQNLTIDDIQNTIETSERIRWFDLAKMDQWFDGELLPASGIDVLAEPFPFDKGYKIYHSNHTNLCVHRMENYDSIIDTLAHAIEIPKPLLELKKANMATDKAYAERYREVLSQISFSDKFIDQIYKTRYATHFYSPEEIEAFKSRWSG